jgi:hypothetical protein
MNDNVSRFVWEEGDLIFEDAKGGPGSGFYGHAGRPGEQGGSRARDGAPSGKKKPQAEAGADYWWDAIGYKPRQSKLDFNDNWSNARIDLASKARGLQPDVARQAIMKRLGEILDYRAVTVRAGIESARDILAAGRFKSQFETGSSNGFYDPEERRRVEAEAMGAPVTLPDAKRPIYGCLQDVACESTAMYGEIEFVLNDAVKSRSTFSVGDSLAQDDTTVAPVMAPSPGALGGYERDFLPNEGFGAGHDLIDAPDYIEIQVHGGVTLADVRRVVFHSGAYTKRGFKPECDAFLADLMAKGIEVSFAPDTP